VQSNTHRIARFASIAGLVALVWLFVSTGIMHLARPGPFVRIVPSYFPHAPWLVYISGICEVIGGLTLLVPPLRRMAAWSLIVLLFAVFPANVNMALHPDGFRDVASPLFFWLRLPVQLLFIAWTAWCGGLLNSAGISATRSRH
jgi:uncharacterized membrane protein